MGAAVKRCHQISLTLILAEKKTYSFLLSYPCFFPIKENDDADLITVICIVSLLSFHLPCLYQARPIS